MAQNILIELGLGSILDSDQIYTLKVLGAFDLLDGYGKSVRPSGRKECAILAMLALTKNHRQSRAWLQDKLWGDRGPAQGSASLRHALSKIRGILNAQGDVIRADRTWVWLEPSRIQFDHLKDDAAGEVLRGFDLRDEGFNEWLREVRVRHDDRIVHASIAKPPPHTEPRCDYDLPETRINAGDVECEDRLREQRAAATMASRTRAPPSNRVQMVLGMAPPIIIGDRTTIRSVANMLCDQILDSLRFHEVIEVFDLRDLATDQLGRFGHGAQPSIELLARLRVVELGGGTQISIQVRNVVTHRIVWSMTLHGDDEADATFNIMRVTEFSAQVVEAIHAAVCQITEPSREGVMQAAVHQLISHSVEGQDRARRILVELQSSSGLAHAWMGYTYAVAHGERHGVLGMDELEEADYHCRRAAELDPSNPLARALIAHTNAFVLQDYAMADEHLTVARRFGPNLAMTWRSAALHAHYTGNANQARQSAERAHRLGQFSPYNGVYSTCHMITSATTGRLRDAITIGEQILKKRPGYLAALRHLSACYALEGKTSKARGLVENIRAIDPSFNLKGIREPSYPLPSAQSIELITEGFSALGMMD